MTDALIEIYGRTLRDTVFSRRDTPGTVSGADYVERGLAEVTLIPSDVAYIAFTSGTEMEPYPHTRLRGMAMLYGAGLHLLTAPGIDVDTLRDLHGKRIGMGPAESATEFITRRILPHLGIPLDARLERLQFGEMFRRLGEGTLDAGFILISYPSPVVKEALVDTGVRIASIRGPEVTRLREDYPFLRSIVIPAGAYGQSEDVHTIGSNWFLVVQNDLSEEIVYRMLTVFFDSVGELSDVQPALRAFTFDRAPESPIPLHAGAARFYRERQLFR